MNETTLSKDKELAAQLIAKNTLTQDQIAEEVGVTRQAIWQWRKNPEFVARIDELVEARRKEIRRIGIADPETRITALNDRWTRMRRLMEARADDPSMGNVPGGSTGLLVRSVKGLGSGDAFTIVEEFAVDTGLLRELREHEKQAAQELGQWTERKSIDDARKAYDVTNPPDEL